MINTCKILRVIAIRTYWAEQLISWSKWEFQPNTYESYVLGKRIQYLAITTLNNCVNLQLVLVSICHIYEYSLKYSSLQNTFRQIILDLQPRMYFTAMNYCKPNLHFFLHFAFAFLLKVIQYFSYQYCTSHTYTFILHLTKSFFCNTIYQGELPPRELVN